MSSAVSSQPASESSQWRESNVHHQEGAAAPDVPARRWARRWRCRCSTRWCRRCRRWRRRRRSPVRRLGFVYMPNGVALNFTRHQLLDARSARARTSSCRRSSTPLAPFRDQMVVVSGLAQHQADALRRRRQRRSHARHELVADRRASASTPKAPTSATASSADQIAAAALGKDTRAAVARARASTSTSSAGHCENGYSCAYMNTLSWRSPTTPLPTENNPRIVFERLFGDGGTPAQRLAQARENRSILDSVIGGSGAAAADARAGRSRHGRRLPRRRARGRAAHPARRAARRRSELPTLERPAGIPERFDEHVKLMFDLQWLAFRADITRVVDVHARPRAELPHLSGDRHHRRAPRPLAPSATTRTQMAKYAQAEHLPGGAVRLVPREAAVDAGRRRHAARSLAVPLRRRPQQPEPARALRSAAGRRRRRGRRARAAATSCIQERDADDEPAADACSTRSACRAETLGDSTGRLPIEPLSGRLDACGRRRRSGVSTAARAARAALSLVVARRPDAGRRPLSLARRRGQERRRGGGARAAARRRPTSTRRRPTGRRRCTGRCSATTSTTVDAAARAGADVKAANRYGVTPLHARRHQRQRARSSSGCSRPAPIRTRRCPTARRR